MLNARHALVVSKSSGLRGHSFEARLNVSVVMECVACRGTDCPCILNRSPAGETNSSRLLDLLDQRASAIDGADPYPLGGEMQDLLDGKQWIEDSAIRSRELGQVRHIEMFSIPRGK